MRTNVDIDDVLLRKALRVTGLKTKKDVLNEGLRRIVRCSEQVEALDALWGLSEWEGDLKALRRNRVLPE